MSDWRSAGILERDLGRPDQTPASHRSVCLGIPIAVDHCHDDFLLISEDQLYGQNVKENCTVSIKGGSSNSTAEQVDV
jgi:hypothetical protein